MSKSKKQPHREETIAANYKLLRELVASAIAHAVAESWKGGGDPVDVPVLEADNAAAQARVEAQIAKLEREAIYNG